MKTYFIIRSVLPTARKHLYLRDGNLYDYLGQILIQQGYDIPDKTRTPEDLVTLIPNFTIKSRGQIRNTVLTSQIIKLDLLDPTTHPQKLATLLAPFYIQLKWK